MVRVFLLSILLLLLVVPRAAEAHSLGIDRAELIETGPDAYRLTSKVPRRIAPAIRTPELPGRCTFDGNPSGERGVYSVSFAFSCAEPLTAGDVILLPWQREGVLLTVRWSGAEPVTRLASRDGAVIEVVLSDWLAGSGSVWRAASRYTLLGIEHILAGIDHLLFVLALLFIVDGRWKLIKTITAFTVAHSITLALATLGFVNLPSSPVEAAIALSIVFLAAEILWRQRGQDSLTFRRPWLVAFAFGLLHGLGFAGALSEIGLPPSEVPIALVFFNIGVELGQLLFIAVILMVSGLSSRLIRRQSFTPVARMVTVYSIGTVATYWFIERSMAIFTTT